MLVKESSKWRAQQAHKYFSNNSDYIIGPVEYTPKLKLVERKLGAGAATEDLIKLLTSTRVYSTSSSPIGNLMSFII